MNYLSTRGTAPKLSFADAVLAGLASDGGLYVPETVPQADLSKLHGLSYPELAFEILKPFVGGDVDDAALKAMIVKAYSTFDQPPTPSGFGGRSPDIAPLHRLRDHEYVLELFHGPTLAFKDFALQFLGQLLDYLLKKRGVHATILGATSGDTGSAAIAGCRGLANLDIYILHPHGRPSEVQRRQMTTVLDKNVHNLAVQGTFDDCQDIVKAIFFSPRKGEKILISVNSINWARIAAQVVYYFYAALKFDGPVTFSVPTGNFGDIYAGYIAKKMGLPIEKLIIASNQNDILTRALNTGTYGMTHVTPTLSPSMDIQISSNFERLLFDLHGRDGKKIAAMMREFRTTKSLTLAPEAHAQFQKDFAACAISDEQTKATIAKIYKDYNYLVDPHTAVGIAAGRACWDKKTPLITLATAHPAKFPEAVKEMTGVEPQLPEHLADLFTKEERFDIVDNDVQKVHACIS